MDKTPTNKYTSPEIQKDFDQRYGSARLLGSTCYTIMANETTDASNKEQMVAVLWWVNVNDFSVHEDFIGRYEVASISFDRLVSVIKDTLVRGGVEITY